MLDLKFDIVTRELVMENNDFVATSNPSAQYGGVILKSRAAHIANPMLGIGIEEVIGGNAFKLASEMNRWQQQVKADSATLAKWSDGASGYVADVKTFVSYL